MDIQNGFEDTCKLITASSLITQRKKEEKTSSTSGNCRRHWQLPQLRRRGQLPLSQLPLYQQHSLLPRMMKRKKDLRQLVIGATACIFGVALANLPTTVDAAPYIPLAHRASVPLGRLGYPYVVEEPRVAASTQSRGLRIPPPVKKFVGAARGLDNEQPATQIEEDPEERIGQEVPWFTKILKLLKLTSERQNKSKREGSGCMFHAGLAHNCDYKQMVRAIDEVDHWNSFMSPGKKKRGDTGIRIRPSWEQLPSIDDN